MKLFTSAALVTALSTAAVSADVLKDTTVAITATSGALDFTLEGTRNDMTSVEIGTTVLEHSYANIGADVRLSFGTDLGAANDVYGRVEYNVITEVPYGFLAYGSLAVQYDTNTRLSAFDWTLDPSVGVSYDLGVVGVYAEVGYAWGIDSGLNDFGGYTEIGVPFAIGNVTVTPSIARTFNTGAEETTANLGVAFSF
jgi:hypothetical protein